MSKFNIALIAAATMLGACTTNPMFAGDGDVFFDAPFAQNTNAQGRMVGDLPEVSSFDTAAEGNGWSDSGYTNVNVEATGDFGWAMLIVDAQDNDGDGQIDDANVIGCSGEDYAEFDEPATEASVEIVETVVDGEDVLEITVDAEFGSDEVAAVIYLPNDG